MRIVIDTNVMVASNLRDTHASPSCAAECARLLLRCYDHDILLEDTRDLVFGEYRRYLHWNGQPGPGDRFFRWYLQNRWSETRVVRVEIGRHVPEITSLVPSGLQTMDKDDHKWIAIYVRGAGEAIYNALDSDWSEHRDGFDEAAIRVVELCQS